MKTRFFLSLCLMLVAVSGLAQDKHPFSVHDMLAMDRISDPQVSPDGQWVAFNVRSTDLEANRGRTDLWVSKTDGSETRRLTAHKAADYNPRWCMNGTIFFLSTRDGSSQIWNIDPRGGEAVQYTDLPLDVGNLEVVPELASFLFTLEVYPGLGIGGTIARDEEIAADPTTGMIYDELMFRHWDTWEDGKRSHLFLLDAMNADAEPVDLMPDLDTDVPTRPWGGMEEVAVAPGGGEIVFTAKILPGSEPAWSTDYDLYSVPVDGSGTIRCLTEANEAWDTEPIFTPDGKTLCYLAMDRPNFEADRYHIEMMDWATGELRRIDFVYDGLKLSPHGLKFSGDGKTIYCTAGYLGQRSLFKIDAKSSKVTLIDKMGRHSGLALLKGRILFGMQHLKSPTELYTIKTNGKDRRQITDLNGEKLDQCLMGEPEQFTFTGWNDEKVYAYVVKPYDWTPEAAASGKKWPVTFLVHGGPQGSFGNDFHYRWNPQAYVGAGFTTVAVDFHGSTGYGQDFTDAISGHWGDRPLEDLEKGLAAALERYSWMDGSKVVASGASYGGYMINWLHGQPFSHSFRAFICHDGNLDERMAYFDTEELWFPEWEHGGTPWSEGSGFGKHNPVEFVQNWHVPTLVAHGALDYRVVDTQGLSTFTALRRQGVPARLLYFPDENHWVLKPQNSIQWHNEVMGWLTRWIR
ncbi:MAG: S9 family peptidase [Gemmatimonadales bacterium]|nr:S9 family peptidase [Gemmatimonadales bacterium]